MDPPSPWAQMLGQYLNRHIMTYAVAAVVVVLWNILSPADRGLFIPMLLWGVVVLAHYLTVRAINTDPDWVEERSEQITMNASDLSHIEDIRERHDKRMAAEDAKRSVKQDKSEEAK